MGIAVAVTRQDQSAGELRRAAQRGHDGRLSWRLVAIAMVLEGMSRAVAAAAGGMDRQTLRDWVHRYNELSLEGLTRISHRRLSELAR
jgi:transposase